MSALRDNPLASFVEDYYKKQSKLPPLAALKSWNWESHNTNTHSSVNHDSSDNIRSRRIAAFMLKGFRKYGIDRYSYFYGVELCNKKKEPSSMVLMGSNGIGKSSLFSALEKAGKGTSNLAKLNGFNEEDDHLYFIHGNTEQEDCEIKVILSGDKVIEGPISGFKKERIPEACFCSDYDVEELEKNDNFSNFIKHQIGLNLLEDFKSLIEGYQLALEEGQTGGNPLPTNDYDSRRSNIISLKEAIDRELRNIRTGIGSRVKKIVEEVLKRYFNPEDGESFEVTASEDGNIKFEIGFHSEKEDQPTINKTPREFLNTFRFKLFVFSLKLALGVCVKTYNNIDCPFIIDDMFDSSDFDNRKGIGEYFKKFVDVHDEIIENMAKEQEIKYKDTGEKKYIKFAADIRDMKKPQIIFFTQDDLIAESLYSNLQENLPIIKGRLFDPRMTEESDIRHYVIKGPKDKGYLSKTLTFSNVYDVVQRNNE